MLLDKETEYGVAVSSMQHADPQSIKYIKSKFEGLGDYKDSKQYIYNTIKSYIGQDYLDACTEGLDNLSDCELIFNGFVASHGCIDIYYDYINDMIKAKNKAKLSKMRKPMIEHMCKINTNICFYPGNYLIKAGDTIGIAIEKQKTKTLH